MVNVEKIIADKLWKEFDILRGYLDLRIAQSICGEMLFIKLLNDQLNSGNKYFLERIQGQVNLRESEKDSSVFFKSLSQFINSNEFFKYLNFEVFQLDDKNTSNLVCHIIELLNSIETVTEEKASVIFKYFINRILLNDMVMGAGTTSPSVNKLISSLLQDVKMNTLYDPTIGTGMLISDVAADHDNVRIYGQDINKDVLNKCSMLLILDERIEDILNIVEGNTIVNPLHLEEGKLKKFDCIIANPPFGLKNWGYNEIRDNDKFNRFYRGIPPRSSGDYAFILHVIESMNDGGTAVIVENTGVLFREGAEGEIRQKLVEENIIDSIIALPNNMMYGTAIPVNLIVFKKNKKTDDILFIDAGKEIQFNKVLTCLTDKNIEDIVKIYSQRTEIEGLSKRVSISEIENNRYNLSVGRYVNVHAEKEKIDINEIGCSIEELNIKLQETQNKIKKILSK